MAAERAVPVGPVVVLVALAAAIALWGTAATVDALVVVFEGVFLVYFVRHMAFAVAALRSAPADLAAPLIETTLPTVTVLVACRNEETVVDGLVRSLTALDYPAGLLQLLVVDDGSDDGTAARLAEFGASHPQLEWTSRPPGAGGGKSGALNDGLERATGEVIVVFDADHQPRPDVLRRLVRHFDDPAVGAVQGRCVIRNPDDSPLTRLIAIDYLAGYLVNEHGRQSLFSLPAYGGANCAVRASSLRAVGGWNTGSVTEDTDLTLRLVLRGERVRYDVTAVDEEEGVVTLRRFWRQRYRWARGHQQVWRDHRREVWRAPRLSAAERVELVLFLLVYHLPVVSAAGLALFLAWGFGLTGRTAAIDVFVLWTLLFLGPLFELGAGLLIARVERRNAVALLYFLPIFMVSIAICTKAWVDGLAGRQYTWVKTARRADAGVGVG